MQQFSLRRLLLRAKAPRDRRNHPRKRPRYGTSILIVDDSKTILFALKKMLEQNGYHVHGASHGQDAIEQAAQHRPALILMDVIMPVMNGFRACRILSNNEETRDIPIIMMSGDEQAMQQFWVNKIGAVDFLNKPFNRADVFQKLEQYLPHAMVA
jgi:twitching motility two-component system response regulator PilH